MRISRIIYKGVSYLWLILKLLAVIFPNTPPPLEDDSLDGYVSVSGTSSNDVITIEPPEPVLEDDYVRDSFYAVTIDAGAGNDKITLRDNSKTITNTDEYDGDYVETISSVLNATIKGG